MQRRMMHDATRATKPELTGPPGARGHACGACSISLSFCGGMPISWRYTLSALLLSSLAAPSHAQQTPPDSVSQPAAASADSLPPQRDLSDVLAALLGRHVAEPEQELQLTPGLSIVALPSVGYNPSFGTYVGIGVSAGGWLGEPATTKVSVFALNFSYSTSKQLNLQFKSDAWVPGNTWNLKGDWRYLDLSQPTHGLGPIGDQVGEYPMGFVMWRLYETAYLRMSGDVYAGLGYHLNLHQKINDERATAGEVTPYSEYSGGTPEHTTASGVSANVLIDSRDSPIYGTRGLFWNANFRIYSTALGSDQNWQELTSDFRAYPHLPARSRNVLAIWSTVWTTFGPAPYLDLPAIGWDTYSKSGRGYVQGRLRAQNQIYNEAEYRAVLTRDGLLGAVAFVNLTASTRSTGSFGRADPGAGIGLRLQFVKRTHTNLTLDYGWGNAASKGLYLGTQEMF